MKKTTYSSLLKKTYLLLVFLLVSSMTFSQSKFYQGLLNQTAWDDLITEIDTKKATLNAKITEAETASLESSYAKGSIVSVSEFVIYATRDRENAAVLQPIYEGNGYRGFNNNFESQLPLEGITGSPDYSLFHPYQQLFDCVNILDFAIAEIQDQIDGNIVLPETLDFSTSGFPQLPINGSYYVKDGSPIFPSTFWSMPEESDLMETIGYLGATFNSPQNTQSPGVTRPNYANQRANALSNQVSNNQTPTQVHYTHTSLPAYMTTAYPGIGDHRRAFVHYDIDHPEITNLNRSMISTFNPQIVSAAAGSPLIYVLSNEPHWNIALGESQANTGVSDNTMNAYVDHLEAEYGNDINLLNTVYNPFNSNKNFTSFDDLKTEYTIPLNRNTWQGTPIWYDWLRFNMNRSNRWHTNLKTITKESDANANVSIKILGREVEDPRRDGGIDLEGLMDIQEVIGFDVQVVPNETHGRNNRFYTGWLSRYIMDWREQSIMLDFTKSLYPNKPTFDSEWHGISSNAWDNYRLDRGYTRSSLWLAFTNGMSVINCWWWYRQHNDGGSFKKGDLENKTRSVGNIMFSPQHQAVAFDTFGRTLKELNAQSNTITSLVPAERDVLIYYSNEAAIQDFLYAQQMSDIYEALKLLNIKVGFTTPNKINTLGYTPTAIVIPPTLFGLDSSIDALNTFNNNNPSVDILQINRFSGSTSFSKDEKGTDDASRDLSFANKSTFFTSNISTLINRLRSNLTFPTPPINFDITEPGTTTEAFGVFASHGSTPEGEDAVSLINVSLNDREIKLPSSVNYINLIDGKAVSSTFVMKPYDVLLLAEDTSLGINDPKESYKALVFPNPANNVLNIVNNITGIYTFYSVTGAVIKTVNSKETSFQINVDDLSTGIYFIEIPTNKGKKAVKVVISK